MTESGKPTAGEASRREFLKVSTAAAVGGLVVPAVHAAGSDTIRVGVIGCGGGGTGAAENAATAAESVRIVALGDTFQDHITKARYNLSKLGEQLDVTDDRCFVGFDAFEKVLACDIDYVIL